MFETIYDLIKDPSNFANWMAMVELVIALLAFVIGVAIIVCYPAFSLAGLIMAGLGAAGLIFGHL